ncbi:transporter [Brevundimonas sp. Root1279]|uniref:transporter n=1 Tax=Brevundimonas sp. Root1279 TaxID=1736443 RepID=UPI0006F6B98F|nr:transporter [Brevundimonas sp. Root1279]KQW86332.1 hypothetical protein ASC65_16620 [Brevundimonas sp. Root1279]
MSVGRNALGGLASLVVALFAAAAPRAQDDGPRVYQLAPEGAQTVTVFWVVKRGDETPEPGSFIPGAEIDTDVVVFRYARTLDLGGRAFTPFAILPVGRVRATDAPESSGLGDAQLGATLGLVGAPALSREAYAAFEARFGVSVLARVFLPTGAYDAATPVNLGSNRAAFQLGLPTYLASGTSFRDPALTSLEVLPTLTFYQDNDQPFGGGHSAKDPLFTVEAHLTRNFGARTWASADLLYRNGGKTRTEGGVDAGRPAAASPFPSLSGLR